MARVRGRMDGMMRRASPHLTMPSTGKARAESRRVAADAQGQDIDDEACSEGVWVGARAYNACTLQIGDGRRDSPSRSTPAGWLHMRVAAQHRGELGNRRLWRVLIEDLRGIVWMGRDVLGTFPHGTGQGGDPWRDFPVTARHECPARSRLDWHRRRSGWRRSLRARRCCVRESSRSPDRHRRWRRPRP